MDKDVPYFAINVPNDMCTNCGYTDDIADECPMCGCKDIRRLRRVTGYLTGDYKSAFNKGKQQEVLSLHNFIKSLSVINGTFFTLTATLDSEGIFTYFK